MISSNEIAARNPGASFNDAAVKTGPGTLAGRFLRGFWQPVHRASDLPSGRAKPIRIMGEEFTLYRGDSGQAHVVAFRCAHRGTQLSTGWVEGDDLRCFYHGWKYGPDGQCIEQPAEPEPFCQRIKIKGYPTQEYLGLIFAYFGEGEPPPIRRFPDFEEPGVLAAGPPEYWPCNFFNRLDNATDGAHVPWTHRESMGRVAVAAGQKPWVGGPSAVLCEETDYGLRTGSIRNGVPIFQTHFHMPITNQTFSSRRVEGSMEDAVNLGAHRLFWRLPVDDESCVSFVVDWFALYGEQADAYRARRDHAEVSQDADLHEVSQDMLHGKIQMRDVDQSLSTYKLFWIEDYVAQCGQGPIADRPNEHPGRSDTGVLTLRKVWERELKALAEGRPLKEWKPGTGLINVNATAMYS
ncbi:MAG: pobA 2 [Chloroflexi bacterium]|nr:pobA 2 [Chloroflexota bacterium]